MKIYLISQNVNNDYDTYDSAVVTAENEEGARIINPGGFYKWHDNGWCFQFANGTEKVDNDDSWCLPSQVKVQLIGEAAPGIEEGVVCFSFNAG